MIQSFKYASRGISDALKSEFNLRIHFVAGLVVSILAYLLKFSSIEWAILVITIMFVIVTEMINTVVEKTIDIFTSQISEKARVAKDISAAAVLFSALAAVLVGCFLFIPKIVTYL